jgi:tetratricopeptide (TPR) repeat protein
MLTDNSLAYDYYLRSKNAPPNKEGLYLIVDLLNKAIELDPNFLVAYADLSKTEGWIYFSGIEKTFAMLARSKAAADKALELDPESAEAHVALGLYFYRGYLDYDRAMYEFEIANKLDPNGEIALSVMAWVVRRQGNFNKSAEYVERALESDPRNATMMGQLFPTYLILGDIEKANEWMDKALDIQPEM